MKLPEIKVIEKSPSLKKDIFIDGIKQNGVASVEAEILPHGFTIVKVCYYVDKFEVVKEE